MCGILGIVRFDLLAPSKKNYQHSALLKSLHHRGPDDSGWLSWTESEGVVIGRRGEPPNYQLYLAHSRLSILDLSVAGHQPMSSSDGRYHIIFNGEIYNYKELKRELIGYGYQFYSESDTEVLLTSYQHWGRKVVDKLIGMFAFAVFDAVSGMIFLARDQFGIKPLFYSVVGDVFIFASEIGVLLNLPEIDHAASPQRIYDYLQYGLTDNTENTLIESIKQLPASHSLEIDIRDKNIPGARRYWRVDTNRRLNLGFREASTQLKDLFLQSVKLHLRSDVPIGAALSGGIDSSAIVCAIRHLQPQAEIHTFTYVAEDESVSEEHWAEIVADHVDAVTHKVTPSPKDLVQDLDKLILSQGEPFGSTSIYAQYRVFQLAKDAGVKVMLDGQGADELLGGYVGYAGARLASLIWNLQFGNAWCFLKLASNWPGRSRIMILKRALSYFIPAGIQPLARKMVGRELISKWLNEAWFEERGVNLFLPNWESYGRNYLREELARSLENISVPSLLRYEDRNSMAHSIESRVPFLNKNLVQFIFSLPEEYLIDYDGQSKAVFREAMRGIVPDEILDRRDKIGFATPENQWLHILKPWVDSVLEKAKNAPMLEYSELLKETEGVFNGARPFGWHIWRCLNFLRWAENCQVEGVFQHENVSIGINGEIKIWERA